MKVSKPLAIAILAAGEGKRMGAGRVKVLSEICGRTAISYPLAAARSLNPDRVVVVIGTNGTAIRESIEAQEAPLESGQKIEFATQENPQGTGHAVQCAIDALGSSLDGGHLIVLYGDGPLVTPELLENLLQTHQDQQATSTMVTVLAHNPHGYGRIVRNQEGGFEKIVEEKDASVEQRLIREINTGIGCFGYESLVDSLSKLTSDNAQGEYYLTDVFGIEAQAGATVHSVQAADESDVLGFNSPSELATIRDTMRHRIIARHIAAGVEVIAPETVYIEDTVQIGEGTRIMPFCVMSGDVVIGSHCYVGPFANMRGGAELKDRAEIGNFVEMKNSVLGEGSKAKHLTYLGDTQIGKKTNIGAGTITANYDGKTKSPTKIGDGSFIGSGTVLVAPVKIGNKAYTGAGSLVLKGRDVEDESVVVGSPAKVLRRGESKGSEKPKGGA